MKTVLTVTLLAHMMIFASMFSLATASTVENVYVRSGEQETITINLQAKQTVLGSFNVSGAGRDDIIDFWVRDSKGAIILDSGAVAKGENFTFTANSDGEYTLCFENNVENNKSIDLEYAVSSPSITDVIPTQILGVDPLLFSGIVIAISAVLAILAFAVYRRHARRRTTQSPIHS